MPDKVAKRSAPSRRNKLGLALAGGGFRASLFHLGVLHRLAQLDILRYVEVLSTVSGGSIIGALYVLLLKKELRDKRTLDHAAYEAIVDNVEALLINGVKKNLRTRLFMNPLGILRIMLSPHSLGRQMGRLYERWIYRDAVDQLRRDNPGGKDVNTTGQFFLKDLSAAPGGERIKEGVEAYNQTAASEGRSVITNLVLNATSLNSGMPFRFSSSEIGDPHLGSFRYSEIDIILKFKRILEKAQRTPGNTPSAQTSSATELDAGLVRWWRDYKENPCGAAVPAQLSALFHNVPGFPGQLVNADFGQLRAMKICAWYILIGSRRDIPVCGGLTAHEQISRFWEAFQQIDETVAEQCTKATASGALRVDDLLMFVLNFYYLRSAEVVSDKLRKDYEELRLGDAVGASACFPPVFPPFIILGIYDDLHVSRLGLTDGGVYDNVGITTLIEENCNYIIASDTSGLFDIEKRSPTGRMGMSLRIVSTLMRNIAVSQRDRLRERRRVTEKTDLAQVQPEPPSLLELKDKYGLEGLAFFHINSPLAGTPCAIDQHLVAALRTDLDGFGDVEIAALINQGYVTADYYVSKYLSDFPYAPGRKPDAPKAVKPKKELDDEARTVKILRVGTRRFFRSLCLGAAESWFFTLAALALTVAALWNVRLSFQEILQYLTSAIYRQLDPIMTFLSFGADWFNRKYSLGVVILVLSAVLSIIMIAAHYIGPLIKKESLALLRLLAGIRKWARSTSGNLLWFFYALPVVLALAISAVAWISHIFYYKPFERVTRIASRK